MKPGTQPFSFGWGGSCLSETLLVEFVRVHRWANDWYLNTRDFCIKSCRTLQQQFARSVNLLCTKELVKLQTLESIDGSGRPHKKNRVVNISGVTESA